MSSDALKQWWDGLSPKTRRLITAGSVVLVAFGLVYMVASGKIEESKELRAARAVKENTRSLLFDGDSLERDLYDRIQADLEQRSRQLDETRNDLKSALERVNEVAERLEKMKDSPRVLESADQSTVTPGEAVGSPLSAGLIDIPPPPPPPERLRDAVNAVPPPVFPATGPQNANGRQGQDVREEVVGGILHVEAAPVAEPLEPEAPTEKKFYLPPSFMEATLLSGMDARIGGEGMENPKPAMLRIAAPAVLPNRVRANLKDCFVVASGYGSLAEKRVNFLLARLACIGKDGQGVIDEKIEGYVADSDSKFGVKGRAVFEGEGLVGRQFLAGAAEGAARALTATATVTSTSALGQTQYLDEDKVARGAIGGAGASGFQSIADLYKELVKQTMPYIEIGAKKKVTVVITKGVFLTVNNYCDECGEKDDIYAIR